MVKNNVVSKYATNAPQQPLNSCRSRVIAQGPLYPDILSILDNCTVTVATQRCVCELQQLSIEVSEIRDWIKLAVTQGGYINSQWCCLSKPNVIAACDAYRIQFPINDTEALSVVNKVFYLKFFVAKTGQTIATVSFHPSIDGEGF